MDDCIFCKIVKGEIPSYKIFEDDNFLAFLDIFPSTEGYTLVIPKKHYRWVWDVENIGDYMKTCSKIANHFKKITNKEAVYSWILGEDIPHAHIHIIPDQNNIYLNEVGNFLKEMKKKGIVKKLENSKAEKILKKYKLN